jgi:hypothetical protein
MTTHEMTTVAPAPADEEAEPSEETPRAEPRSLDEDDRPRALWERAIGWGIVAIATLLVFLILDPGLRLWPIWKFHSGLLFTNTTTNGGDMGAHVWWPWFLERHWFAKGRLSGWAPDWYAGFPVGQYYFPLPAVMIAILNWVMPYNVAFKLVTVSGPLMLPASAYYFARGLRAPWPAPPAFSLAVLGLLVETRNDWQIYGGNIASTLAGEFSFTMGLAFALFGLGALAHTLDTGKRRWLPAALIAAAVLCHVVIAIFVALAAFLIWITRRPAKTWPLSFSVGFVAIALTAVWTIPLVMRQAYTQSMRYTKLIPRGDFKLWSWLPLPGPIRYTIEELVRGVSRPPIDTNANPPKHFSPTLWLPWWIWLLAGVAIVFAGWYRRRSTLVLLVLALVLGIMFVEWPEHAIWNTRFLPFWLLSWGLLAAMGATEIVRALANLAGWSYRWIRDGDLQDARAHAWAERATSFDDPEVDDEQRKDAAWALAERRFDRDPEGWEPPERLAPERVGRSAAFITTAALSTLVVIGGIFALNRAWDARDNNPGIVPHGWATWNYSGYEKKPYPDPTGQYKTSQEFFGIMNAMDDLAKTNGNGRVLWEPSSMDGDPINNYGTSLALELLPYYTDGRIASMEGLYFESSGTTSYHFLTVSECAEHPSNPVRGLVYGSVTTDFDMCVKHLQMLGVKYLMLWTKEAQGKANANRDLKLVKVIPDVDGAEPKGWNVYEVADSDQVVGMTQEPAVVKTHAGSYSKCWDTKYNDTSSPEPQLSGWECTAAPWWTDRDKVNTAYAQSGPSNWQRIDSTELGTYVPKSITPTAVSDVKTDVDSISFHVSEVGKPVEIKTSYFPNWKVKGAKGPYRLAPNLMVVVPTSNDVSLTYGFTAVDWLGRFVTLLGIAGLVGLILWRGAVKYAAEAPSDDDGSEDSDGANGHNDDAPDGDASGDGAGSDDEPPERKEPQPALP